MKPIPDFNSSPSQEDLAKIGELVMIGIPEPMYRMISDIAAKQNMTMGKFLARALEEAIQKNESTSLPVSRPRLLTEG